jgi:ABC-type phosphate/phosphonate transport system permease subunit
MSYHRDYLKKQSIKLGSTTYDKPYKRCKNKLNSLIKNTKEEYFKAKLSNAKNRKESWQAINELLKLYKLILSKTIQIKQLNINDRVTTDDDKIADSFNEYFSTSCTLSDKIICNDTDAISFMTSVHGNSFNFTSITIQETINALIQIKSKKSLQ